MPGGADLGNLAMMIDPDRFSRLRGSADLAVYIDLKSPYAFIAIEPTRAMARSLGMVGGMLVTSVLISFEIGDGAVADHPERFLDTMVTAFAVFSGLNFAALIVSLRSRRSPSSA